MSRRPGTPVQHLGRGAGLPTGGLALFLVVATVLLALFVGLEAAGVGGALHPAAWARQAGPATAATSFLLLVADVVLPVPSSLIMVANGSLFGPWAGAALSALGNFAASMLAFALGRRMCGTLRRVPPPEASRSREMLERWGLTAVILSRPLPLLAEAVAIVAGASQVSSTRFALGSLVGSVPIAGVYAGIGASAVEGQPWFLLLGLYLITAAACLLVGRGELRAMRFWKRHSVRRSGSAHTRNP